MVLDLVLALINEDPAQRQYGLSLSRGLAPAVSKHHRELVGADPQPLGSFADPASLSPLASRQVFLHFVEGHSA